MNGKLYYHYCAAKTGAIVLQPERLWDIPNDQNMPACIILFCAQCPECGWFSHVWIALPHIVIKIDFTKDSSEILHLENSLSPMNVSPLVIGCWSSGELCPTGGSKSTGAVREANTIQSFIKPFVDQLFYTSIFNCKITDKSFINIRFASTSPPFTFYVTHA